MPCSDFSNAIERFRDFQRFCQCGTTTYSHSFGISALQSYHHSMITNGGFHFLNYSQMMKSPIMSVLKAALVMILIIIVNGGIILIIVERGEISIVDICP